jgi:hypothetical protein
LVVAGRAHQHLDHLHRQGLDIVAQTLDLVKIFDQENVLHHKFKDLHDFRKISGRLNLIGIFGILYDQLQCDLESPRVIEEESRLWALLLVFILLLVRHLSEELHVNGVIGTFPQLFKSFGVEAAPEVLAESVEELVVAVLRLVSGPVKDVPLVGEVPALRRVFLSDLPNFLDVGLLLKVFLHKIFELERLVVQRLREVLTELVSELWQHALLLSLQEL